MLRTILKSICLLLLLVSMSGCLVGLYDDGWDHRDGGHGDGHGGGGRSGSGGHGGDHDDRR